MLIQTQQKVKQALQIHLTPNPGDILIFMPGQEAIEVNEVIKINYSRRTDFFISRQNQLDL